MVPDRRVRKYQIPEFLLSKLTQAQFERWLRGRAAAHVKRDRRRGNAAATGEDYRVAIHRAVVHSDGRDDYTGEPLDWSLLGRYNNAESKARKRDYKATMALLPSIDHVGDGWARRISRVCIAD
jgi:hypothetical protein